MLNVGIICGLGVTGLALLRTEAGLVKGSAITSVRTSTEDDDSKRRAFIADKCVSFVDEKRPDAVWVEVPEAEGATNQVRSIRNILLVGEVLGALRHAARGEPWAVYERTRTTWHQRLGIHPGADVEAALQRRLGVASVGRNEQESIAAAIALYGSTGGLWSVRTKAVGG